MKISLISEGVARMRFVRFTWNYPIENLNSDQLRVYKKLANHMNTGDSEQLFFGAIGSGCTGKSYLIHVMSTAISNKYGCIAIIIGAPTGVSARNVSGNTLHQT